MMKRKLARYVEAQQSIDLSALTSIIEKDLAEAANSKQTNFPRSNFESQFKYLPKLPESFQKPPTSLSADGMEVDEINGKKIIVYTFDEYMALHNNN